MSKFGLFMGMAVIGLCVVLSFVTIAAVKHFDLGYTGTGVVLEKTYGSKCYVSLEQEDGSVDRTFVYGKVCYSIEIGDTISVENDMLVR